MTEYTLTYTVEITEVKKSDEDLTQVDENALANWIGAKLDVDDVHVKSVKVFPREVT